MVYPEIDAAIVSLAAVCDGAATEDGQGFAKCDVQLGHDLARFPDWNDAEARVAYLLCRKYVGQLGEGLVESLPEPPATGSGRDGFLFSDDRAARDHVVGTYREIRTEERAAERHAQTHVCRELERGRYAVHFPYNADLVAEVKECPGRRFDPRERCWNVPGSAELVAFLERHAFSIECDEIALVDVEPEPEPVRSVTVEGGKIIVRFPYDAGLVAAVKRINGRRFAKDGNDPRWIVPATLAAVAEVRELVDVFRMTVEGLEELEAELRDRRKEAAEAAKLSAAKDSDFTVEGLGLDLYPFQRAGVEYLAGFAQRHGGAMNGDTMGLGKTGQAIGALHVLDAFPALIIVPASLKLNWAREVELWRPGTSVEVLEGRGPDTYERARKTDADVVIVNYDVLVEPKSKKPEGLVDAILERDYAAVVGDELHYMKNRKANRTKAMHKISKAIAIRIGLTGTPFVSKPVEGIELLKWCGMFDRVASSWKEYVESFCDAYRRNIGGRLIWETGGASNLDELNARMRASGYVRRTKEEVLPDLPAKTRTRVDLELTNRKEYNRAVEDFEAWLAEVEGRKLSEISAEALVKIGKLRQLSAKGKLDGVCEWIENVLDAGEPLVVMTWHRETLAAICKRFPKAVKVEGGDSSEDRQAAVDAFQSGKAPLFVGQIKAAGVGLTLTRASNIAFAELAWTPGDQDQAEDRVHRIGQDNAVTVWNLVAPSTIDEYMLDLIERKREVVTLATDGEAAKGKRGESVLKDLLGRFVRKEAA